MAEHPLTDEARAWIKQHWSEDLCWRLTPRALDYAVILACRSPDPRAQVAALAFLRERRQRKCDPVDDGEVLAGHLLGLGPLPDSPWARRHWAAYARRTLESHRQYRQAMRMPTIEWPEDAEI